MADDVFLGHSVKDKAVAEAVVAQVFISYSRKDAEFVHRLDDELRRRGREAWVDWEGIRALENWEETIYGAIEGADTFIFVLTPDSVASQICGREIKHAAVNNKRMVPLVARDVEADTVQESLAKLNWIFCRESDDFQKATDTLLTALDTDLDWVHAHTDLLTQAIKWDANSKSRSLVLRGEALKAAEQWLAQAGTQKERQPTELQTEYILASRKEELRRQRIWRWSLTAGVVMVSLLAILAWLQRGKAVQNEAKASQTLAGADFLRATEMIDQQRVTDGLAHLARAMRSFPPSHTAADRSFTLLTQRSYPLPANPPVKLEGRVTCVRFLPGDRCLLAMIRGNSAQVFDARSGEPISKALAHDYPVQMAELSADGKLLATACGASEDRRPSEIWPSRKTQSSGNVAATAGYGRVWDVMTSAPVTEPLAHQKAVFDIGFSPDTSRVVTGSEDQTARVWDARTGKPLTEPMHHTASVVSTRFNAEGTRILAVAGGVTIWDLNGNPIASCATGAIAAKYTPDGRLIAAVFEGSGGEDEHFADTQIIDAATGKEIGKLIGGAGSSATSLSFDRGSKRLLETFVPRNSNKEDAGGLQEIDLSNLDAGLSPFPGEANVPVRCAVFTPEERRILAGLPDHTARLWDRYDSERKPQMAPAALPGEPVYLEFEPSGSQFLVLSSNYQSEGEATENTWVQFWRRTTPQRSEVTHVAQGALPTQAVMREGNDPSQAEVLADTSRDKKRIVKIGLSGTVRVYDTASGKTLGAPIKQAEQYGGFFGMQTARFSNDGRLIATGEGGDFRIAKGMARVWDASTGTPVTAPLIHNLAVTSVVFSSDNERLATIEVPIPKMTSSKARIWDVKSGQPLSDLMAHNTMTFSAEFNNERTRLIQVCEGEEEAAATREIVDIGLPAHGTVPVWVPRLAEAVAGKRLNEETGVIEDLPDQWNSIEALRTELASLNGDDAFTLFGRWFLAETTNRTISPYSKVTVRSYIDERIKSGDDSALDDAEDIVGGNKELHDRVIARRSQK
jgi:WD40 repeat protein